MVSLLNDKTSHNTVVTWLNAQQVLGSAMLTDLLTNTKKRMQCHVTIKSHTTVAACRIVCAILAAEPSEKQKMALTLHAESHETIAEVMVLASYLGMSGFVRIMVESYLRPFTRSEHTQGTIQTSVISDRVREYMTRTL
jgi:hypothetical protein